MKQWIVALGLLATTALSAQEVEKQDIQALRSLSQRIERLVVGLNREAETQKLGKPWTQVVQTLGQLAKKHPVGTSRDALATNYKRTAVPLLRDAKRQMYAEKVLCYQPHIRPFYHSVRLQFRRVNRALIGDATPDQPGDSK